MPQAIPFILTAASVGTSIAANRKQAEANEIAQNRAEGQAALERRRLVRQQRIERARILNASAQTGGQNSSSEVSALSNVSTNTAFNGTTSFGVQQNSRRQSRSLQAAANLENASGAFSQFGNQAERFI